VGPSQQRRRDFLRPNKTASSTADRYVYFVPDLVGLLIDLIQSDGTINNQVATCRHRLQKYAGVGNAEHVPDPFVGSARPAMRASRPGSRTSPTPGRRPITRRCFPRSGPGESVLYREPAKNLWVTSSTSAPSTIDSRSIG
jgi:hypothetical protein